MSDPKTVLVTGSAGRVGQAAVQGLLKRGHSVRGFDRAPSPGLPEATVANLSDLEALKAALPGYCLLRFSAEVDFEQKKGLKKTGAGGRVKPRIVNLKPHLQLVKQTQRRTIGSCADQ